MSTTFFGQLNDVSRLASITSVLVGLATAVIAIWRWLRPLSPLEPQSAIQEVGTVMLFGDIPTRLVRCADTVLVLADTQQGLVKLSEIRDPVTVARIMKDYGPL